MKQAVKRKWVKKLLNPRIKQTKGRLHNTDPRALVPVGYCCLGVLRTIIAPRSQERRGRNGRCTTYGAADEFLGSEHLKKAGLRHAVQKELAELNDQCVPFPVIAGFINENL